MQTLLTFFQQKLFVCVELLQPSQLNGVMSSVVSLPNHTYWAGLVLYAINQYCAYSFARNWQLPYLNQRKGENDCRKYFVQSPRKNVADPAGVEPGTSWSQVGRASNWATENGFSAKILVYMPHLMIKVLSRGSWARNHSLGLGWSWYVTMCHGGHLDCH